MVFFSAAGGLTLLEEVGPEHSETRMAKKINLGAAIFNWLSKLGCSE